jgi:hypothetical protein
MTANRTKKWCTSGIYISVRSQKTKNKKVKRKKERKGKRRSCEDENGWETKHPSNVP